MLFAMQTWPFPFLICTINWFGKYCNQFLKLGHQLLVISLLYYVILLANYVICKYSNSTQQSWLTDKLSNMIFWHEIEQYVTLYGQSNHGNHLIHVQCTSCRRNFNPLILKFFGGRGKRYMFANLLYIYV